MPARRILSLWFPRLAADRALRGRRSLPPGPFAVLADRRGAQVIVSLCAEAEAAGLRPGQPLRDAMAICPHLATRPADPTGEAAFLTGLRRWAGRFSPWVAEDPPDALRLDITGCAHLFGGEPGLIAAVEADCAALGLSVRPGIADTLGAAWALARFAGTEAQPHRTGDAIAQEARATRSRAARRAGHGRDRTAARTDGPAAERLPIAPPGQTRAALAPLPMAALRLDEVTVEALARLGLRRVGDILGMPRAPLARRFGRGLVDRLDQALGAASEPVSPARPAPHLAVRLSLPEPIGLETDLLAAIDRLLPALGARLEAAGLGARRLRLQAFRTDRGIQTVEVGLARATAAPDRMRPLLALKLGGLESGNRDGGGGGIDRLRLKAVDTEPLSPQSGRFDMAPDNRTGSGDGPGRATAERADIGRPPEPAAAAPGMADLIGRLGARIGLEAVTRLAPAESHIPEKSFQLLAAAWSDRVGPWPRPDRPRPLLLLAPEPVAAAEHPEPPDRFRWRQRAFAARAAAGPERLLPEWWLDDPAWRSGPRDYWRVDTDAQTRLWLFYAHGAEMSAGWFCQGRFA
ncbi:DNA polymerase Y family protein [Rhodovulum sp. BSW8]|uniref:Protein ImuB n=1 Tax=Rhodovulum visakhapatnamense TaxID=364297 RepID=A0A4R8G9H7_9RHOB|nr:MULTISPECIES: DNA polymerase Y family protein [Rhodovulum]RBO52298.1 DNA polymerase Y family protein [Rhodovulum sp. BSW8]TDX33374.1 protein ImuB [Rhodovulum visakhapatnamense]